MKFTYAPETRPLAGYTIKRAIDRGGFGEVYYGLSDSGKEVALKLLQQNQQIELRGVSQCLNLKHPNLVTLFDIRTDDEGDHWVVMEYVAGKSLEQVLDENRNGLPAAEVEQWLTGIAAGVGFLHDRGVVHRDLKPANIFRENGVVKIGDVGLSKFITPSRRSAQTESVGTVYYMAPEVAHGKYGSELDVYSLGIILFEMLTGKVPFNGESTGEILMKHLTEPPDLTAVPAVFRPVIGRALEKDPQRRTPTAMQLADEFRRAVRGGTSAAVEIPAAAFINPSRNGAAARSAGSGTPRETMAYAPAGQQRSPQHRSEMPGWLGTPLPTLPNFIRRHPLAFACTVAGILWVFGGIRAGVAPVKVSFGAISGLMMLGGLAYASYWVVTALTRTSGGTLVAGHAGSRPTPPERPPNRVPVAPPVPSSPAAVPVKRITPRINPSQLSPATVRRVTARQRLSDLSTSMTLAVVWSLLATAAVGFVTPLLGDLQNQPVDWGRAGLFALTSILAVWTILVPAKLWEGTTLSPTTRRIILTFLGAAVGTAAFWIDESLLVHLTYDNGLAPDVLIRRIGRHPLLTESLQSTLAGYAVFFAALFGARRWWWQADAFRSAKFRVTSLLFTMLVAFLLPAAFAFPLSWSVAWGTVISAVVQLSAPWVSVKQRVALLEGK